MTLDVQSTLADLIRECRARGTRERAEFERGYLKTDMAFYGATVPDLRKLARSFTKAHRALTRDELSALVAALYDEHNHNLAHIACLLLAEHKSLLKAGDARLVQELVRRSRTWALVDMLAVEVLGDLAERHASVARALPRWSRDEDLWVRRSSLLAHLLPMRRGDGDLDAFLELALPLAAEKEFFIRKAIGWVLREASKQRPDEVYRILLAHRDELSGLSLREAAKRLSPARRESLR